MGYTTIGNQRVYGRNFSYGRFGPTDITYELFIENQERLEEVVYTAGILEEKFGCKFPTTSFRLSKLKLLPFENLVEIAHALGIDYKTSRQKPTLQHKRALRRSVLGRITK
jgi:hypothetical protein